MVYFVKGACEEELNLQGRGGEPDVWLDSFDDVTPCVVQEVGTTNPIRTLLFNSYHTFTWLHVNKVSVVYAVVCESRWGMNSIV